MHRSILRIAIPSIISNITVPLLGIVDVAITGHLGSEVYLGAIAVGGMLFNVVYWMFVFLRMGTSGLTAQAYGRRDFTAVMQLLVQNSSLAAILSVLMLLLSPLLFSVSMWLISPSAEVAVFTRQYFQIVIWGAPPSLILSALNGWFIGMQNSRIPMVIAIFQNILNILLSLLFVYSFGMEIRGVALGTLLAQWGGLVLAVVLCWYNYGRMWSSAVWEGLWRRDRLAALFSVNRDIFLRTLCMIVVHFFFISAGARLGNVELAVNTLLMQFFTLFSYFMDGFAFAGEALTGKAIGARNKPELHSAIQKLFVWGILISVSFTVLYAVAGTSLLSLLTDNASVADSAMHYRHWTLLFPLCGMAAFVWDGIYIGATKTRPMFLSTLGGMAVFIALFFLLSPSLGNHGLWIAYLSYLALRGVVLTVMSKALCSF